MTTLATMRATIRERTAKLDAITDCIRTMNNGRTDTYQCLDSIVDILNDHDPNGPLLMLRDAESDAYIDRDG
jgi:hypothetical protein